MKKPVDIARVTRLLKAGESTTQIALAVGRCYDTIRKLLKTLPQPRVLTKREARRRTYLRREFWRDDYVTQGAVKQPPRTARVTVAE